MPSVQPVLLSRMTDEQLDRAEAPQPQTNARAR